MSYQEENAQNKSAQLKDDLPTAANATIVRKRPKLGCDSTGGNDYIGIDLFNATAVVQSGKGLNWVLSEADFTATIESLTILESNPQTGSFDETDLNCTTYASPKRIEIYVSDKAGDPPYLVFQEVLSPGVTGWQLYSPASFDIVSTPSANGEDTTWQYAVSTEPVSILQVRVYQNCNFSIQNPPPPGVAPLFEKITSTDIGQISIQI